MNKSQKILSTCFTNIALALVVLLVAMTTIIDPAAVTVANVINGAIYSGNTESNKVSLMINVYWGTEFIDSILSSFKEADMHTTFFIGGTWAKSNPDILKKIVDAGHEIGSHGYNHKDHDKLSREENYNEIYLTHTLVKDITGKEMTLFAPPSGAFNKTTIDVASGLGYKTIMWTRDTIDWRDKDENLVYTRATNNIKSGDLILMHPTAHTAAALPKILSYIKSKSLACASVSEVINETCSNL